MDHLILSPSGRSLPVAPARSVAAVQERWPGAVTQVGDGDDGAVLTLQVRPRGEPVFQVLLLGPVLQVATDGTPKQALEVAELTTSLISAEAFAEEWWFASDDLAGRTVLGVGMTTDDIAQGWTRD